MPRHGALWLVVATIALAACRATPTPPPIQTYADPDTGIAVDIPFDWLIASTQPGQLAILQSYPVDKYLGGENFQPGDTKCDLVIHAVGTTPASVVKQVQGEAEVLVTDERVWPLAAGGTATVLDITSLGSDFKLAVTELAEHTVSLACYGTLAPFETIAASLRAGQ